MSSCATCRCRFAWLPQALSGNARVRRATLLNRVLRIVSAMVVCGWLAGCASLGAPNVSEASTSQPIALAEDQPSAVEPLPRSRPRPKTPADAAPGTTAHKDSARADPRIERALGALGTRYRYGGNTPESGFDCSGFVRWIYQEIAGKLPRSAHALSQVEASEVEPDALQPGDVLFFRINRSRAITHVGMYVGNGQFIHAPSSGGRVRVESVQTPYWRARLVKARRWALPGKSAATLSHDSAIVCVADHTACFPARPGLAQLNPQPFVGELRNSQWNPTPASASFSS